MNKKLIHTVIRAACCARPDTLAVTHGGRTLTYGELGAASDSVAAALSQVTRPGDIVCSALPRSRGAVAAMLGIFSAGRVYMPISPGLPAERAAALIARMRPAAILAEDAAAPAVAEWTARAGLADAPPRVLRIGGTATGLTVDAGAPGVQAAPADAAPVQTPEDAAYILFSSGSTGAPKAIEGTHKGLSHFIHWEIATFAMDASERVSWLAPAMFDVSLRDILAPLLAGGTVVIPDEETVGNAAALLAWMEAEALTTVHCVPSVMRLLLREAGEHGAGGPRLRSLRRLLLAGEPLYGADVREWRRRVGTHAQLVNLYGPSETTLAKLYYPVPDAGVRDRDIVPLGGPISNTAVLILDGDRLAGIGELGEICIKTPFRTNGYRGDPAETARRFVVNPLGQDPSDIIYRTGDLGRYLPDRTVVFEGRMDHQVKVRGNRVALGEVASLTASHPGVSEAAVVAAQGADRETQLVCFYRPKAAAVPPEALIAHILAHLPRYMLPSRYIAVAALPLLANGKVDLGALTEQAAAATQEDTGTPPAGETEQRLHDIWCDLLGVASVDVTRHFFEVGGHSLLAMRLLARVQERFGAQVTINELFDAPTVRRLAALIERRGPARLSPIPRAAPAAHYPLSPAQQRLWTLERLGVDPRVNVIAAATRVDGPLDAAALEAAFADVTARHEALRTAVVTIDGAPRQVIRPAGAAVRFADVSSAPEPMAAATAMAEQQAAAPFELEGEHLLRSQLVRVSDTCHVLALAVHHIIADAWSLDVLARDLAQAYAARLEGRAPELSPLRFQHTDLAVHARAEAEAPGHGERLSYWKRALEGPLPALALPTDRPRPAQKAFTGGRVQARLDGPAAQKARLFQQAHGVSLFAVLLGAVKAVLHRHTGQTDIIVGTTTASRQDPRLQDQIGFYVNTLALRDRIDGEETFSQVVLTVDQTLKEAFANEACPFDAVVEALALDRDPSRHPVFDVAMVLHAGPPEPIWLGEATLQPLAPPRTATTPYDLFFVFNEQADGLELTLIYDAHLFDAPTAARMAGHVQTLLGRAAPGSRTPIGALDLLDTAETERILAFSGRAAAGAPSQGLLDHFRQAAADRPDHPALVTDREAVSYRALDRRSDAWAVALRDRYGIAAGDRVALVADRTPAAIAAMLGVLKAGAAYVPIDPTNPPQRIADTVADAACRAAIATGEGLGALDAPGAPPIIDLETAWPEPAERRPAPVPLDAPAYIIYTSGSTGAPKGVAVSHANAAFTIANQIALWRIDHTDRVGQFASLGFDASVSEIFTALTTGATLAMVPREAVQEPARFVRFLAEHRVTVLTLPPSYLALLGRERLPSLRVLITAGERAVPGDALFHGSYLEYWNAYGPTEATIHAATYRVEGREAPDRPLPIGRPVPGVRILILNEHRLLCPIGVPGEIYIEGPGVAAGYLNRRALTEAAFVWSPLDPEARCYRTGDFGQWLPTGDIAFLGRRDDQVKIRGHRIELGEIARQLAAHDAVAQAHVAVDPRAEGPRITGFFTPRETPALWPSVAEFYVYDDVLYRAMWTDAARNARYRAAFERHLPGQRVLEIGPGPEAVLSRMAVAAGARRVYAVELLEETYRKACRTVAEHGLADRITVIHGDARTAVLPEPVDVCISEIVGGIGGSEGAGEIINAARRFLRDPSRMLPERAVTRLAAVALPPDRLDMGFSPIAAHYVRRIFEENGGPFDLRLCLKHLRRSALVSSTALLEDLDFTREVPATSTHEIALEFDQDAAFTGLLAWLELHVDATERIDILDAPGSWLPVYFPAGAAPIPVRRGDRLVATVERRLGDNRLNPDFFIEGRLRRSGAPDLPIRVDALHRAPYFREHPFYKALFAGGEIPVTRPADAAEIRAFLKTRLPDYMVPGRLCEVAQLPVTTAGKVDTRALFEMADAPETAETPARPLDPVEERIAAAWRSVTGRPRVGPDEDFFAAGGDSIRAIQLSARLGAEGISLDVQDIFRHPTVAAQARAARLTALPESDGPFVGEVRPLPIHRWFFEHHRNAPHHFNQSLLLGSRERLDAGALTAALAALVNHHDGLRLTAPARGGERGLHIGPTVTEMPLEIVSCEDPATAAHQIRQRGAAIQESLRLETGPLVKAALFRCAEQDKLLLCLHHLVVDAVSWHILLADLETAYRGCLGGEPPTLPPRTCSLDRFAEQMARFALGPAIEEEHAYWSERAQIPVPPLRTDHPRRPADRVRGNYATLRRRLDPARTAAFLAQSGQGRRVDADDQLVTALALTVQEWLGHRRTAILLEGHGRDAPFDGCNVTRTVGWLTAFYPAVIDLQPEGSAADQVRSVATQLRAVPGRGLGYGALRYLARFDPRSAAVDGPTPEIALNYLGRIEPAGEAALFSALRDDIGEAASPETEMATDLSVVAVVAGGALEIDWMYNARAYEAATMARVADIFARHLAGVVDAVADTAGPLAPADLSVPGMSAEELDGFLNQFE